MGDPAPSAASFTIESHEPVRESSAAPGLGDVHAEDPGLVRRELLGAARR